MAPDPPDLFDEANGLIDDIRAGKGLSSLSAATALSALDDMVKRVKAYKETHLLPDPDAMEDVLDDLADLRDEIAASGLPPHTHGCGEPRRSNSRSCKARSSLGWISRGMSPTSSRNKVP